MMSATAAETVPDLEATAAAPNDGPKAEIACLICRSRKVRCDRSLPDCRNCIRLGVPCPRYDRESEFISRKELQKSADDIFRAAGVEKRKVGSCEECRSSKHRCTKTRPSCRRCILRNLTCVYPSKHERELSAPTRSPVKSDHRSPPTGDNADDYDLIQQRNPSPRDEPMDDYTHPMQQAQDDYYRRQFQPLNNRPLHSPHASVQGVPGDYRATAAPHAPQVPHPDPTHSYNHFYNTQAPLHTQQNGYHQTFIQPDQIPRPQPFIAPIPEAEVPPPRLPAALGNDIEGLYSEVLPEDRDLRLRLVEAYFQRSAALRNLSFVHKPSFMKSFDQDSVVQDYGEPLLYIMCALGARSIFFDHVANYGNQITIDAKEVPGEKWSVRAREEALRDIHAPTFHHIMTMVLLCDYGLREDRNAMVYVLVAVLYRMVRLLDLDSYRALPENATPAEIMERECEIRLVWACYYLDVLVGNGVEKNLCWRDDVPSIPLPCPEQDFLAQTASHPYFLEDIERSDIEPMLPKLDFQALSIVILRLRTKVMHLIRNPNPDVRVWDPTSSFLQIIDRLDRISSNLPEKYQLTDLNMYILKDSGILGAVFVLHLLMHAVIFDLCRVSLAGFNFPLSADFKDAPLDFKETIQGRARYHADQVSQLFRRGMAHGRNAFDDLFCVDAAFESSKIQLVYAATVKDVPQVVQATRANLCTNLDCLKSFSRDTNTRNSVLRALLPICTLFGFRHIAEKYHEPTEDSSDAAEVTGSADMHHLSRLAPFRRGQSELKGHTTHSDRASSSSNTRHSPVAQSRKQAVQTNTANFGGQSYSNGFPMTRPGQGLAPTANGNGVVASQPGPSSQRGPLQLMPSAGVMMQHNAMLQPSVDDYIKTADEMSNLLTWTMPDIPPWMSLGDMMAPT